MGSQDGYLQYFSTQERRLALLLDERRMDEERLDSVLLYSLLWYILYASYLLALD